jgi:hypothetical protein
MGPNRLQMGNDKLGDDLGPNRQAWSVNAPACKGGSAAGPDFAH